MQDPLDCAGAGEKRLPGSGYGTVWGMGDVTSSANSSLCFVLDRGGGGLLDFRISADPPML